MRPAARFARIVQRIAGVFHYVAGAIILTAAVGVTINAIARYGFSRDVALITEAGGFVFCSSSSWRSPAGMSRSSFSP